MPWWGEVWGRFHISAPQPKAEDAAGLNFSLFFFFFCSAGNADIFGKKKKKTPAGSARWK